MNKPKQLNEPEQRRLRRVAAAAAVLLAAGLVHAVTATPAAAWPGLVRVTATTASDNVTPKTKTVACPSGKQVIGGGGELNGALGNVVLNWLVPRQATNDFEARAARATPGWNGSWSLKVYAICANPIRGRQFVSVTAPGEVTATCPGSSKVLGVGGRVNGGPVTGEVVLEDVFPTNDLKSVKVRTYADPGSVVTWNNTAVAVCVPPIAGQELVKSALVAGGTANITCPGVKKAHGTGAVMGTSFAQRGHVVLDEVIPNAALTNVKVFAYKDTHSPPPGWTIQAYAICAN